MRTILIVVVLLIVGIGGLGFYRGWFRFSSETDNTENTINTTFTVDEDKIREDKERLQELGHQEQEESSEPIDQNE